MMAIKFIRAWIYRTETFGGIAITIMAECRYFLEGVFGFFLTTVNYITKWGVVPVLLNIKKFRMLPAGAKCNCG
jgi:hypothetical protein